MPTTSRITSVVITCTLLLFIVGRKRFICRCMVVFNGVFTVFLVFAFFNKLILFMFHLGNRCNLIIAFKADQTNALSGSTHYPPLTGGNPDNDAGLVDDHQIIVASHIFYRPQLAGLIGHVDGFHTSPTAIGYAVILNVRSFAVTFFGNDQNGCIVIINTTHANYLVVRAGKGNPSYTRGGASHRADGRFVEPDCSSRFQRHYDLAASICEARFEQLVAFVDVDGIDAVGPRS